MGLVRPGQVASRTVTIECHDEDYSFADRVPEIRVVGLQNPGTAAGGDVTYRDWEYADVFTPTVRPVEGKNAVEVELRLVRGLADLEDQRAGDPCRRGALCHEPALAVSLKSDDRVDRRSPKRRYRR